MSRPGRRWPRWGALMATGCAVGALAAVVATATTIAQGAKAPPTQAERLQELRRDARRDFAATAAALREIDPETAGGAEMGEEDRLAWLRLARETAVRIGDAAWLAELRGRGQDPFSEVALYRILLAGGHLEEGDLASAHGELARVGDLGKINERDRRRFWALEARLARLEADLPAERAAVERIVHELQYWPTKTCQGCHDDAKFPDRAPLLDLEGFWFGKRYAAILQETDDAARVLAESDAALEDDAADVDALVHRGYALIAQGRMAEARECFARIEWFAAEGRVGGKPRMMTAYP